MILNKTQLGIESIRRIWARSMVALGFAASAVSIPADRVFADTRVDTSEVGQLLEHETPVSNWRLFREIHKKQLINIDISDLKSVSPDSSSLQIVMDAMDNKWPIYVDTRQSLDDNPRITLHKTSKGSLYVVANEAAHQWTEAYIRSQYPTRRDLQHLEHIHTITPVFHLPGGKEIENDFNRMANGMGESPAPLLYVHNDDVPGLKDAEAGMLADGTRFIFITRSGYRHWNRIQTDGMLCHELGHEIHNDVLPHSMAAAHNDYAVSRKIEQAADANAANKACLHPEGLLQVLQDAMQDERNAFFAVDKQATEADYIKYDHDDNGATHPAYLERISAVEKWIRSASPGESAGKMKR
jgi:Zn-dependent protease with chaperone function